jgi:hypothetical protein
VEIEAAVKMNDTASLPAKFGQLNTHFAVLFPKFPQDYAFSVTYAQCSGLTSQLAVAYTQSVLSQYMSNCSKPFNDILKKVNSSYTVVPKAKASPVSGPSPLTVTFDAR